MARVAVVAAHPSRGAGGCLPSHEGAAVHARPVGRACTTAALASGRRLPARRGETGSSLAWRVAAGADFVDAIGATRAEATTAKRILAATDKAGTADGYQRSWLAIQAFCAANNWPSLPTSAAAIACYYGAICDRGLKASTMRAYLRAVNNMHAAAGYARPTVGPAVAKLSKRWARILADHTNALPPARKALPATAMWQVVAPAGRTTDSKRRRRFTAVILSFLVFRRTSKILEFQVQDTGSTLRTPDSSTPRDATTPSSLCTPSRKTTSSQRTL